LCGRLIRQRAGAAIALSHDTMPPMPDASRLEYERRMHRVLAHIDRHLGDPLDLPTLAGVAHFSAFHFHRLFAAWMGETLGDYTRRRRVEVAAAKLSAQPRLTVLQAALDVGFGSSEAFSRAFKSHFGVSPSLWRAKRHAEQRVSNSDHDAARPAANNGASLNDMPRDALIVKIIERSPAKVAYLRQVGPYGPPVNQFWGTRVYPWLVANGLLGQPRYGIAHDDPSITDPAMCRYDAGAEVPPGFVTSLPAFVGEIAGGRYAVLHFKGNVLQVTDAWTRLLRDWLPSSGLQLDSRPCHEHYAPGVPDDMAPGVFECDICIPVAPL
jgi:AraC family transcriptional regulator